MTLDLRAEIISSKFGTVISGSLSDDSMLNNGLIKTNGSIVYEGVVTPDVQVRFDYGSTDTPQPPNLFDLGTIDPPSQFGDAVFGTNIFGGGENPLIRIPLQGSGYSNNFTIISDDAKAPYTINGFYIDFIPSGRR